jgi:D-alanyl-D-alanine carboxypeptidase
MRRLFAALALSAAIAAPAAAQEDVSDALEALREANGLPALAGVAVSKDGGVIARGAAGVTVLNGEDAASTGDAWHLGSLTKMMTAVLAARLAEQGALEFDITIGEVLGGRFEGMDPGWRDATLRQLITHRAGIRDVFAATPEWRAAFGAPPEAREHREAFARLALEAAPRSAPGEEFSYSNGGYVIAGLMMETLTGESWEALMAREVFEPLGLDSAGFGPPPVIRGHTMLGGPAPEDRADNPAALGPAGTVHMSLDDYAAFIRMVLQARDGESDYLSRQSMDYLLTPAEGEDYALGWMVLEREWAGGPAYHHSGSNTMWFAVVWMAPEKDIAVIAATNSGAPAGPGAVDRALGPLLAVALE